MVATCLPHSLLATRIRCVYYLFIRAGGIDNLFVKVAIYFPATLSIFCSACGYWQKTSGHLDMPFRFGWIVYGYLLLKILWFFPLLLLDYFVQKSACIFDIINVFCIKAVGDIFLFYCTCQFACFIKLFFQKIKPRKKIVGLILLSLYARFLRFHTKKWIPLFCCCF